eukprot:516067-Pyramimonas_sp.AAC.1
MTDMNAGGTRIGSRTKYMNCCDRRGKAAPKSTATSRGMSAAAYGELERTLLAVSSFKMLTPKFLFGTNPRCERIAQSRSN